MTKYVAIIAEFNPLHNGHVHLISCIKRDFPEHKILAVMSGAVVQRGEFAVAPTAKRAEWAVRAGIDLVLELPIVGSLSSAENFAYVGLKTVLTVSNVEYLAFGSESGNIDRLYALATALTSAEHGGELSETVRSAVKDCSYPKALEKALLAHGYPTDTANECFLPNNILAINYLKAITKTGATLTPVTYARVGDSEHAITADSEITSAGALRRMRAEGIDCTPYMPTYATDFTPTDIPYALVRAAFDRLSGDEQYEGLTTDLRARFRTALRVAADYSEFLATVKTKSYTMSRIKRIVMSVLLGVTADVADKLRMRCDEYVHVAAVATDCTECLSDITAQPIVGFDDYPAAQESMCYNLSADNMLCAIQSIPPTSIKTVFVKR